MKKILLLATLGTIIGLGAYAQKQEKLQTTATSKTQKLYRSGTTLKAAPLDYKVLKRAIDKNKKQVKILKSK